MILSLEYFEKGKFELPNAKDSVSSDNRDLIQSYIDRYESELLTDALGVTLYNEVKDASSNFGNATEKIQQLVNGHTYDVNGQNAIWIGLNCANSLLVPYVYYKFIQDQTEIFGTFGVERSEGVNSQGVSSINKATTAWRDFIEKYQTCDAYPNVIRTAYVSGIDYYGAQNTRRSLYQFLNDNVDTYGDTNFRFYENQNSFGI